MVEASPAQHTAVRAAVIPARMKDKMSAGPASGTASVRIMKIPVPIVAPTPNIVSWNRPIERLSSPPSSSGCVSVTNASTGFLRNTLRCSDDDVLMPFALAVSVGALVAGVHRQISLVQAGSLPFYLLVPRVVLTVFW